ncbi:MAG: alginate export family protein [Planctomycetes bacterium]|nr:alginate export family protein [Planctomycetota bacterium]
MKSPLNALLRRWLPRTIAAVGLSVLTSTAGFAQEEGSQLEWNVSGSLRVRGFYLSNGTLANQLDPTTLNSLRISGRDDIDATQEFLDTRLRLQLKVTAYQQVSAVMALEVGDITFGVKNAGGALGADGVVFENKNLYLEWHPTRYSFRVRAGLYPRESDPRGLILSNDVAGVHGEIELLGTATTIYADMIKAVESSRLDLDGDGVIDNDYNDRTLFIAGLTNNSLEALSLEAFLMADVDNTNDSPLPANSERDVFWIGLNADTRLGPIGISTTAIGAYGRQTTQGQRGVRIRGFAVDTRITFELPFVSVEAIVAWASGRNPSDTSRDEGFPTVTPFYGVSGIVYGNYGGFNATGSNLSGTAHATLKLRAQPSKAVSAELVVLWAWYTSDRDVSNNVNRFNRDARDLGFEVDLNLTYQVLTGFKAFARGSILLTGRGYTTERDARHRGGPLSQVIIGMQLDF